MKQLLSFLLAILCIINWSCKEDDAVLPKTEEGMLQGNWKQVSGIDEFYDAQNVIISERPTTSDLKLTFSGNTFKATDNLFHGEGTFYFQLWNDKKYLVLKVDNSWMTQTYEVLKKTEKEMTLVNPILSYQSENGQLVYSGKFLIYHNMVKQ
ncbi:hypothetical protein WG947_05225 [Pontibacter sp. H259]|uniref:hypothetical protein n=1 Tax=Pontibacter sp. H259 TaxID=3133421 RepID=UPI0030C6267E